jgi:hypothetical protein
VSALFPRQPLGIMYIDETAGPNDMITHSSFHPFSQKLVNWACVKFFLRVKRRFRIRD